MAATSASVAVQRSSQVISMSEGAGVTGVVVDIAAEQDAPVGELGEDPLAGRTDPRLSAHAGRMTITGEHLPEGAEIYLCGGSGFLRGARAQLLAAGAEEERMHVELFSPNDWLLPGA